MTEPKEEYLLMLDEKLDFVYSHVFASLKKDMAAWEATITVFRRFFSADILNLSEEEHEKRLGRIIEDVARDYRNKPAYISENASAEEEKPTAPHGLRKDIYHLVIKRSESQAKTSFLYTEKCRKGLKCIGIILLCGFVVLLFIYTDKKKRERYWEETEIRYGLNGSGFETTDFDKVRSEMEKDQKNSEDFLIEDGDFLITIPPEY